MHFMKALIRKAVIKDSISILKLIKELALFEKESASVILTTSDIEKHGYVSVSCGRGRKQNCRDGLIL